MPLSPALLAVMLQLGPIPNPSAQGAEEFAEELRNRPERSDVIEAPANPVSVWLQGCLDQLESDPARAHTQAQIRRNETTGSDRVIANHCLGLAATELQLWDDARTAFLAAREETPVEEERTRARFALMAGNAALGGGDAEGALGLMTTAETEARAAREGTIEALASVDRARALVSLERPEEALAALDNATRLIPQASEPWLLKATLLRRLDRLADAQAAIERAGDLAPLDPQIGLEAGVIAVLDGRDESARASWQSVIDAVPESPQAETARGYIAQLGPAASESATP